MQVFLFLEEAIHQVSEVFVWWFSQEYTFISCFGVSQFKGFAFTILLQANRDFQKSSIGIIGIFLMRFQPLLQLNEIVQINSTLFQTPGPVALNNE